MELIGIIEVPEVVSKSCAYSERDPIVLQKTRIVADVSELASVDVAILSCPSRVVRDTAKAMLQRGIRTVDSFDMHHDIPALRKELTRWRRNTRPSPSSLRDGTPASTPSSGDGSRPWRRAASRTRTTDPGSRWTLGRGPLDSRRPGCHLHHRPRSMGVHRRMVYVQLKPGAVFEKVEQAIKKDPYFVKDRPMSSVDDVSLLMDTGHGVLLERNGVSA